MRLYVSGPMTGLPDFNYPAFHDAKERLHGAGYDVVSPADLPIRDDWEWLDYILVDIDSVFAVDGIATLPGHEQSKGARIEHRIAERRDLPIQSVEEWLSDSNRRSRLTADELNAALAQEWCNGCGKPRALWGPVCGGMTQGDMTHYHSPAWWRQRFLADPNWCKR